ncbi:MAG: RibD family protein [Alphaproteobacteria bacterium]|nr:RibD family protein [Alphaproteobacteria bacterium]
MRPFVTLKLATSLDGRIATAAGESRWITGAAARAEVHRLRAAHDAILVGAETALADDPELTARTDPAPATQPLRIVLDSRLRLSPTSRLARTVGLGPVLVLGATDADPARAAALEAAGVAVARVSRTPHGVDLPAALAHLSGTAGVRRLFVEGGGHVAASFLTLDAVDALEWFRAPMVLGGAGRPAIAALPEGPLAAAPRFARRSVEAVGPDLWERYERER